MTHQTQIDVSPRPRSVAVSRLPWLGAGLAALLLGGMAPATPAQPPSAGDAGNEAPTAETAEVPASSPAPPSLPQVTPDVFEQGPGVLGVSIHTLRKALIEAYPTPALGFTALGLEDLRLSPVAKDGTVALDLNEELEFAFNSHQVPKQARPLLDGIARLLVENPDTAIQVVCHTDDQGDAGYNLRLSERRAESLKAYLVGRGVADQRITAVGKGEEAPLIDTGKRTPTRAERAKNRRTELVIAPLGVIAGEGSPTPSDAGATSLAADEERSPAVRPAIKGAAGGN